MDEVAYEFGVRAAGTQLVPSPDEGGGERENRCGTYRSPFSVAREKTYGEAVETYWRDPLCGVSEPE